MIIYFDVDEVLAGLTTRFLEIYNQHNGTNYQVKHIRGWDFEGILKHYENWWDYTENHPDFWRSLPLTPWARDFVRIAADSRRQWAFCTSLPMNHPGVLDDRRVWLRHKFGDIDLKVHQRLIVARRKELVVHEGDVIVEDNPEYAQRIRAGGGTVLLLERPWNKDDPSRKTPEEIRQCLLDLQR